MVQFLSNLVKEFITWQSIFLTAVVIFLTETLKRSTEKFINRYFDTPGDKHAAFIDFAFSWFPVVAAVFFAIFIPELFPKASIGMRILFGLFVGGGSSVVYRLAKKFGEPIIEKILKKNGNNK